MKFSYLLLYGLLFIQLKVFCYISLICAKNTCWFRNVNLQCSLPVLTDISYILLRTGGIFISLNLLLLSRRSRVSVCFHTRIVSVLLAHQQVKIKEKSLKKYNYFTTTSKNYILTLFLLFKIWNPCMTF